MLVDDVDGGEAAETVKFALDGVQYEIDLSDGNAAELRSGLEPFVGAARRLGRKQVGKRKIMRVNGSAPTITGAAAAAKRTPVPVTPVASAPVTRPAAGASKVITYSMTDFNETERKAMRVWGRANGYSVKDRGRVPEGAIQAWVNAGKPL
jgi:hypothetical protein